MDQLKKNWYTFDLTLDQKSTQLLKAKPSNLKYKDSGDATELLCDQVNGSIALPDDAGEGDDDAGEREDRAGSDAEAIADERVNHDDHHQDGRYDHAL